MGLAPRPRGWTCCARDFSCQEAVFGRRSAMQDPDGDGLPKCMLAAPRCGSARVLLFLEAWEREAQTADFELSLDDIRAHTRISAQGRAARPRVVSQTPQLVWATHSPQATGCRRQAHRRRRASVPASGQCTSFDPHIRTVRRAPPHPRPVTRPFPPSAPLIPVLVLVPISWPLVPVTAAFFDLHLPSDPTRSSLLPAPTDATV